MSAQNRRLLEATLFNLRYDMDCIGDELEMYSDLETMSDDELENILNEMLSNL